MRWWIFFFFLAIAIYGGLFLLFYFTVGVEDPIIYIFILFGLIVFPIYIFFTRKDF